MASRVQVEFGEKSYMWDGHRWYDAKSFEQPPHVIIKELNHLLVKRLQKHDLAITESHRILHEASIARESQQYERAEKLTRRVLNGEPDNLAALAVLCAVLRARGKPKIALSETEKHKNASHAPLLTSRAAALCDLKRWDEAKRVIGRALAISSDEEAFAVMNRVKSAAPELYGK